MLKLTSKLTHVKLVGSRFLTHSIRDLEKTHRSISYAAVGIQGLTIMFLLVRVKDLNKTFYSVLGVGMLGWSC